MYYNNHEHRTLKLCNINDENCNLFRILGSNFYPNGSTCLVQEDNPGILKYLSQSEVICEIPENSVKRGKVNLTIKDAFDNEDTIEITIYDSNCEDCKAIGDQVLCLSNEHACILEEDRQGCFAQGAIHPGDQCLHCIEGQWIKKSGKIGTLVIGV
jgi:hypothetical protein